MVISNPARRTEQGRRQGSIQGSSRRHSACILPLDSPFISWYCRLSHRPLQWSLSRPFAKSNVSLIFLPPQSGRRWAVFHCVEVYRTAPRPHVGLRWMPCRMTKPGFITRRCSHDSDSIMQHAGSKVVMSALRSGLPRIITLMRDLGRKACLIKWDSVRMVREVKASNSCPSRRLGP